MRKIFALMLVLLLSSQFFAEDLYLIYAPGCPHCQKVETFLTEYLPKHPGINLVKINLTTEYEKAYKLQKEVKVPFEYLGYTPKLIYKNDYCIGDVPCIEFIQKKVEENAENISKKEENGGLTIVKMTALAAVDAINPCALAVLIILLSMALLRYEKNKKMILFSGLAFTLAIFIAYLSMGLLIIAGYKAATEMASLQMKSLRTIIAVLAIVIGIFNLKDYFNYGGFGFVMEVPFSWRPKMKKIIKNAHTPIAAFIAGIIVSLFLLPCTAGPYFVASAILAPLTFMEAMPWLIWYNLIFIMPMLGITLLVYLGLAEMEKLQKWRNANIRNLHLFAALILIVFGILMLLGIF